MAAKGKNAPGALDAVFNTRTIANTLEGLMKEVTKEKCTPETVNAACNCADKIVDILRLHLDVERLKMRHPGLASPK